MLGPFAFLSLGFDIARLATEAQSVITMRLARISSGDFMALPETMLMFTEKAAALGEANMSIATAAAQGRLEHAPQAVVNLYRKRVRANRRRLSR